MLASRASGPAPEGPEGVPEAWLAAGSGNGTAAAPLVTSKRHGAKLDRVPDTNGVEMRAQISRILCGLAFLLPLGLGAAHAQDSYGSGMRPYDEYRDRKS